MKAATAIGIGIAAVAIIMAGIMEGVAPAALINTNALILVLGGTAGAIFGGVGMKRFMLIPKLYMKAITIGPAGAGRARHDPASASPSGPARTACWRWRRRSRPIEDPFMRKGMQLVVDGTDPDLLREILDAEIDAMAARHKLGSQSSRRPAAWPRPSACSAPSCRSCTCSAT